MAISRSLKFQTSLLSDQLVLTCKFHQHSHSSWCEEIYQQCLSTLTKIWERHILVLFSPISWFPLRHARHNFSLQPATSCSGCVKLSINMKQQFCSTQYMRLMPFKCRSVLRRVPRVPLLFVSISFDKKGRALYGAHLFKVQYCTVSLNLIDMIKRGRSHSTTDAKG